MASSDSQIDKPQRGHPKRAELLEVNINTGAQSINTESAHLPFRNMYHKGFSLFMGQTCYHAPDENSCLF